MKNIVILIIMSLTFDLQAQIIGKDANKFIYEQYDYGEVNDTSKIEVWLNDMIASIKTPDIKGTPIQGYAKTHTYIEYPTDSITVAATYRDSCYYYRTSLTRNDIEWNVEGPAKERKYTCSINSNTLIFVMDETTKQNATPLPHYGLKKGVLKSFTRNGQMLIKLVRSDKINNATWPDIDMHSRRITPRELDRIMKERLVITTRIFDNERIYWGAQNDHFESKIATGSNLNYKDYDIPFDTTLHFAGGTVILKRLHLPKLPSHYQHFIEIHQNSNGDAYDRTGSLFVIPMNLARTFIDGINCHPDSLPTFTDRKGQKYQGIMAVPDEYEPPVELVHFFTPFGIGYFNDKVKLDNLEWRDETYYKQEVTDLATLIQGDVVIGAWIGNYSEGHLITVDLKSYPNFYTQEEKDNIVKSTVVPLFNTCNVLEMAGQNYGKLFDTDSLTVEFNIPVGFSDITLRYISTGHGGWGEGDEFTPKKNTIIIDGKLMLNYTPWRTDCGCHRDLNPASGNFWNGTSSSDFSRSGWCPGTATQPVYFNLTGLESGTHTITIAIPQGKPVEGMFSHWAVSGALIIKE